MFYRPITNLSFVSKIVERLVVNRLAAHSNQQSSSGAPVSLPTAPFDRDRRHQRPKQYHTSDGHRSHVSSCVVGP